MEKTYLSMWVLYQKEAEVGVVPDDYIENHRG